MVIRVNSSPEAVTMRSTVLTVEKDRVDAGNHRELEGLVRGALAAGAHDVVLDLGSVTFADSSALAALVRSRKRVLERQGRFILCGLREPVRHLLELTRLYQAFEVFPDAKAATEALGG